MWNKKYSIDTLHTQINKKTIQKKKVENKDTINQWIQAWIKIGEQNKLPEIHTNSLAGKIASFSTGQLISTNTEKQIKEGKLDDIFFKKYQEINKDKTIPDEKDKHQKLITEIINFYTTGKIIDYELSIYRVNGNVSKSDLDDYNKVPGINAKEKLHFLIQYYNPDKEFDYFGSKSAGARIDSYLTYTDYMIFKSIPADSTRKKIHVLLECYKSSLLGWFLFLLFFFNNIIERFI